MKNFLPTRLFQSARALQKRLAFSVLMTEL
jgi:hypothetical protein